MSSRSQRPGQGASGAPRGPRASRAPRLIRVPELLDDISSQPQHTGPAGAPRAPRALRGRDTSRNNTRNMSGNWRSQASTSRSEQQPPSPSTTRGRSFAPTLVLQRGELVPSRSPPNEVPALKSNQTSQSPPSRKPPTPRAVSSPQEDEGRNSDRFGPVRTSLQEEEERKHDSFCPVKAPLQKKEERKYDRFGPVQPFRFPQLAPLSADTSIELPKPISNGCKIKAPVVSFPGHLPIQMPVRNKFMSRLESKDYRDYSRLVDPSRTTTKEREGQIRGLMFQTNTIDYGAGVQFLLPFEEIDMDEFELQKHIFERKEDSNGRVRYCEWDGKSISHYDLSARVHNDSQDEYIGPYLDSKTEVLPTNGPGLSKHMCEELQKHNIWVRSGPEPQLLDRFTLQTIAISPADVMKFFPVEEREARRLRKLEACARRPRISLLDVLQKLVGRVGDEEATWMVVKYLQAINAQGS